MSWCLTSLLLSAILAAHLANPTAAARLEVDIVPDWNLIKDEQRVFSPVPPLVPSLLTLLSFNVPTINVDQNQGEGRRRNAFRHRAVLIAALMRKHGVDIAGFQEFHSEQAEHFVSILDGDFEMFGRGRDADGGDEFQPIFWRSERFKALDKGVFWLSPQPNDPGSQGWDGAYVRHAVWVRLEDKRSGQEILVGNTHLDHVGKIARLEGAKVLKRQLEAMAGPDLPIIITGDFNDGRGSPSISVFNKTTVAAPSTWELADASPSVLRYGSKYTWDGWNLKLHKEIDFVMYRRGSTHLRSVQYGVLTDRFKDGRLMSDHYPLLVQLAGLPVDASLRNKLPAVCEAEPEVLMLRNEASHAATAAKQLEVERHRAANAEEKIALLERRLEAVAAVEEKLRELQDQSTDEADKLSRCADELNIVQKLLTTSQEKAFQEATIHATKLAGLTSLKQQSVWSSRLFVIALTVAVIAMAWWTRCRRRWPDRRQQAKASLRREDNHESVACDNHESVVSKRAPLSRQLLQTVGNV